MVNFNIPEGYPKINAGTLQFSASQFEKLDEWMSKAKGSLILHGEPGRGKTAAAITIMRFLAKFKGIPLHEQKFLKTSELNQFWLTQGFGSHENYDNLQKLQECRVLCIDDVGVKKPSDGFLDYLYCIIDYRSDRSNLITIYSTNLDAKETIELLGPRIVSRMSGAVSLKMEGKDLRKEPFIY